MNIKNILSVRLIVVAVVTALIIALPILALVQEPAVAAPPPPLKGPFKFIELPSDYKANSLSGTALLTPTVIYSDTFDNFVPVINPNLNIPGWQLFVNGGATDQKWGRILLSDSIFTNTLWSTGYYSPQQSAGSTYVPNMDTWVVYGPLNNNKFRQFQVQFDYYLDTDPGASFGWAASADGQNFCGPTKLSGHIGQWLRNVTFDLPSCPGQSGTPVYLAFFFQSDASAPSGLGAFVDNVVISGVPWLNMYLPYVRRDPTPTASPTPIASPTPVIQIGTLVKLYTYETEEQPRWCQNDNADQNWTAVLEQPAGGTSKAYRIWVNRPDIRMESPQYDPPANYGIETKFSFFGMNGFDMYAHRGARFGLIFSVEGVVFNPWDEYHCDADPSGDGYYQFLLKINDAGNGYDYKLRRLAKGSEVWAYADWLPVPSAISISSTGYNTLRLNRNGSGIAVYINGGLVVNTVEGTWTGTRWWGFFIEWPGASDDSDFKVNWDDTGIYNLTP